MEMPLQPLWRQGQGKEGQAAQDLLGSNPELGFLSETCVLRSHRKF